MIRGRKSWNVVIYAACYACEPKGIDSYWLKIDVSPSSMPFLLL